MKEIIKGQKYRHFKGIIVEVLEVAKHSETEEILIIYRHLDTNEVWARPISMFNSLVDKEKYPDSMQVYRFELIG